MEWFVFFRQPFSIVRLIPASTISLIARIYPGSFFSQLILLHQKSMNPTTDAYFWF